MTRPKRLLIVDKILKPGNCIQILDGKKFGELLGELLKIITVAEEKVNKLQAELDKLTPEGLKKEETA